MAVSYPGLFAPLQLGRTTLRNRFVCAGHGTLLGHGSYSEPMLAYLAERARGGAAMVISQANFVSPDYGDIKAADDSIVPQWAQFGDRMREHGALAVAQLQHPGSQGIYTGPGTGTTLSPSPVPIRFLGGPVIIPREMTEAEIWEAVEQFAAAAARARQAGLDGVEVHCAHGNLIEQFLDPATNTRTDAWGATPSGRMRFATEVLTRIRDRVGPDFLVGARVTGGVPGQGISPEHLARVEAIDALGVVDYLSVSAGHYSSALGTAQNLPDSSFPPAVWRDLGLAVKQRTDTPVILAGRITSAELAAALVREGACDAVGMARTLIADPFLPLRALEGTAERTRPCVGIQDGCWSRVATGRGLRCAFNPEAGLESSAAERRSQASTARRVVVVGSGPAGMEAARQAADLGHRVILMERSGYLGGLLPVIARAPHRHEITSVVDWFGRELEIAGVDVRTGAAATPESILAENPDVVVLATGSRAAVPEHLLGGPVEDVRDIRDAFGPVTAGAQIVVADTIGGRPALSVAEYLAAHQARVTFVTGMSFPGEGLNETVRTLAHTRLLTAGVTIVTAARVQIQDGQLTSSSVHAPNAPATPLPAADTLITAYPRRADLALRDGLAATGIPVIVAGDALAPRDITTATAEGNAAARQVDQIAQIAQVARSVGIGWATERTDGSILPSRTDTAGRTDEGRARTASPLSPGRRPPPRPASG